MLDAEDDGTRIGVWVALGVVCLVLAGVIGGLVLRQQHAAAAARAKPAAADALQDLPLAGELLAKLYFESGSALLPADAAPALDAARQALAAAPGGRLLLAGFHDASGDARRNAELARQRALAARAALLAAGADAARVVLRRPESTTGDGSLQEARRVEVRLLP